MTVTRQQRRRIRAQAGGCCEYCRIGTGEQSAEFHIDHIIAISHGGQDIDQNLCLACLECNSFKSVNVAAIDPQTDKPSKLFHPPRQRLDKFLLEHLPGYSRTQVQERLPHAFANEDLRSEVHDAVKLAPGESGGQGRPIVEIANDQGRVRMRRAAMAFAQVVIDDDFLAKLNQHPRHSALDTL